MFPCACWWPRTERDLNRLLQKVLTKAGYTVDGCYDGEEAQLCLLGAEYDALVLDVMMPKKDGYTLVRELRAQGVDTPVLFLTARDSVADRVTGLDLGADDYLVKPFDFDELLARIRAITRKHVGQRDQHPHRGRPHPGHRPAPGGPGRGGDPPAAQGVRHFGVPHAPPGHRPVPGTDRGPHLELRIRWQLQQRGRLHEPPAEEDRRRAGGQAPPHRPGDGLDHPGPPPRGRRVPREDPQRNRPASTLWYTLLMAGMGGLLLGFLVLISGTVSTQTAMDQLEATLRRNLSQITPGGRRRPPAGGGVRLLRQRGVHPGSTARGRPCLAGQVPVSFTASEPFQNGQNRPVDVAGARYYVMDFWLPNGWESGLWVRGILEAPENPQLAHQPHVHRHGDPARLPPPGGPGGLWHRPPGLPAPEGDHLHRRGHQRGRRPLRPGGGCPRGTTSSAAWRPPSTRCSPGWRGPSRPRKQFTADASHELRTPVSVIKSACEYAEKYGETPEEQRETLAMIHRQADRWPSSSSSC